MLNIIVAILYCIIALIGIFVITPYAKARKWETYDSDTLAMWIIGSIVWPLAILGLFGAFIIKILIKIFLASERYFTIKQPVVNIDESKSDYRTIKYE